MNKTPLTWQEFWEKSKNFKGKQIIARTKGMKNGSQTGKILDVEYGCEELDIVASIENREQKYKIRTDEHSQPDPYPFELEDGSIEITFQRGILLVSPEFWQNPDEMIVVE